MELSRQVKSANKDFYNKLGSRYEQYDGRRSDALSRYVQANINQTSRKAILDLGCGSGFVARSVRGLYDSIYGLDISYKILHDIKAGDIITVNADIDRIPFKTGTFDCVVTFATLHHCYDFNEIFNEIYRVLNKGGLYYSDHDMNDMFYNRYELLMKLYRGIFNNYKRYKRHCPEITEGHYHLSEYHSKGIPTEKIKAILNDVGFSSVTITYHWFGLNKLTDRVFGTKEMGSRSAPLVKIKAIK